MLPSRKDIEIPLLEVLLESGGQARVRDVYPLVADKFPDTPQAEFERILDSGRSSWKNRVRYTRQKLVEKGEIDSPARGIWRITKEGRNRLAELDTVTISVDTPEYIKGELVSGADLRTPTRSRKSRVIRRTVPKDQVSELLKEGFEIAKEFKRSIRMEKSKPIGEQFENEIWLLMKQLGFSTLNRSRRFFIDVSIPSEPTTWEQVDVFAKDGQDHVFIIECKYSESPASRNRAIKSAINNFAANDSRMRDAIRKYFRDDKTKRLKITYVIATRNISWSRNNLNRARRHNVYVWKDEDIDRLQELARLHSLIGDAVRYQLYASMFRGQDIRALDDQRVAAIMGKAGDFTYYQFIATPEQLLPIAFVHRRSAGGTAGFEELKDSYQRMLKKSKVRAIGSFIDERKYFPNNIIISFDEPPRFDLMPGQQEFNFESGTLTLPNKYGSAWVIDGQHRLYGFANSNEGDLDPIPVIAFRELSVSDQANLFIEINKNQTNVGTNLLWDLYGDIYQGSTDKSQIEELTISNIVKHLDTMQDSPLRGHVYIPSHGKKGKARNITMSTLCQGIKRNKLIATDMMGRGWEKRTQEQFEKFAADRIAAFFRMVKNLHSENWQNGDEGYLRTNNGISALLIILMRILRHLNNHMKYIYIKSNTSEFEEEVFLLLSPAIEYLHSNPKRSEEFRRRSGQGGQQESANELLMQIRNEYSNYFLLPLDFLKKDTPEIEPEEAPNLDEIIKDTELQLRSFVKQHLKELYGDAWYRQGIPGGVKNSIKGLMEFEIKKHPYREAELRTNVENRLEFTSLGHLKDIIISGGNWSHFEPVFKSTSNVEGHFTDYNDLRNAYRGHMRKVDPVLMARGRAAMTWIRKCIENAR